MTNQEKIESKRQAIDKCREVINKYQTKISDESKKIKKLEEEIDQLAIFDIKCLAKEANLPITELRSVLSDLLTESSAALSDEEEMREIKIQEEAENDDNN